LGLILFAAACSRPDPEVVRLVSALEAGDREGRQLAQLGPDKREHLAPVFELLERDNRRFVQLTCLEALLSAGAGEDALPAVEKALQHGDGSVVNLAALAHWKISGQRDPGLERLFARATASPPSRPALLLIERAAPIPESIAGPLVRDNPLPPERLALVGALGKSAAAARPAVEKLLDAEHAITRIQAADALYRITGELQPAVDRLVIEFRTDNLFLRGRIAPTWLAMRMTHPDAMENELRAMLSDENASVRNMAVVLLGDTRAIGSKEDLKRAQSEDPDPIVRAAAERALRALDE